VERNERFYRHQPLHVLQANFHNTQSVTVLANMLLKIKHARFGSIAREQLSSAMHFGRAWRIQGECERAI
jgi:hypothetical protein